MKKDLFSKHASLYAAFRPTYPPALYDIILRRVISKERAWDCATGNGQVAQALASHFDKVIATDISQEQLNNATKKDNIQYLLAAAEDVPFAENSFNLVTVAQALHWIDVDRFYAEVRRTARPGCQIAVWGYGLLSISKDVDILLRRFYEAVVGPYWDAARAHIDNEYRSIPFPFSRMEQRALRLELDWTAAHLSGYLESWSATQGFIRHRGYNPVTEALHEMRSFLKNDEPFGVSFPIFLKIGDV